MMVPEIVHLPLNGVSREGPTPVLFDISATVLGQKCKKH